MQHVFRYNKTERYLMIGLLLTTVIVFLVALVLDPLEFQTWGDIALGASIFLTIGFLLLLAWATHVWQLTVDDTGLHLKNWRRTRHIRWDEFKGYRIIMEKSISIEFVAPQRRPYTIQYTLDDQPAFIHILHQRLSDLEMEEFHAAKERIFTDEQFGSTEEERVVFLQKARVRANSWSLVAVIVSALPLFLPQPTVEELILPIVVPFVLLAVSLLSKGSILLFSPVKALLPNIALGLILGPSLLMFGAIFNNILIDNLPLVTPMLVIGVLYAGILVSVSMRQKPKPKLREGGFWLMIYIMTLFYTISVVIWTNRMFDQGPITLHRVEVLSKRSEVHAIVFYDYYAKVNDWLPFAEPLEIELDHALYKSCQPGDSLLLTVRPGFWGARWVENVEMRDE